MVLIRNRQRKVRLNLRQIGKDSTTALRLLGLERAELSLLFVNHSRIRSLNLRYRGLDRTTDVLSFPIYESNEEFPKEGEVLLGDIVINAHRAQEQAREAGHSLKKELRILLVHGLVHLVGLDHEQDAGEGRKMRRMERKLLRALGE